MTVAAAAGQERKGSRFFILTAAAAVFVAALVAIPPAVTPIKRQRPEPLELPAPDIGALREETIRVAKGCIRADWSNLLKWPFDGTSSSSSEPGPPIDLKSLARGLKQALVPIYETLVIPDDQAAAPAPAGDTEVPGARTGSTGLNFGVVMYDDSAFAHHSPAPTRLEGSDFKFTPAAFLSRLCDGNLDPPARLPEDCAKGGSLSIELSYFDLLEDIVSQLPRTPEVFQTLAATFHIILFWSPAAEKFYRKEVHERFNTITRPCVENTNLQGLTEEADASTVRAAIDGLSAEVARCLIQGMQAAGHGTRGVFVGDQHLTTQNYGGGHVIFAPPTLTHKFFKVIPTGTKSVPQLRVLYLPDAPAARV